MFNLLFFALLVYRHFDNTNRTGGGVGKRGGGGGQHHFDSIRPLSV